MKKHRSQHENMHITYISKNKNDPRRHKTRCKYYKDGHCVCNSRHCWGSSQCLMYKEVKDIEENLISNKNKNKKKTINCVLTYYIYTNGVEHVNIYLDDSKYVNIDIKNLVKIKIKDSMYYVIKRREDILIDNKLYYFLSTKTAITNAEYSKQ